MNTPVTLRGITWEHERGYGSVHSAASAYRQFRPEVEVVWDQRPLQAFADQSLEDLTRDYDLLVIDHPHIPQAAQDGLFARLDNRGHDMDILSLERHSVGLSHRSYEHCGGLWALALDAAAQVSAHRPDLLSTAPQTWPEVLDLAARGKVLWPHKPVDAWSSLITVAANSGEEAMRIPGTFLSAPALEAAMDVLRRLAELVPEANAAHNPIEVADALAEGTTFAYAPLLFGYTNYSRKGFRTHRLAYRDIPRVGDDVRGSLLGGAGIAVSASSTRLDEAVDHAFWLASGEVQEGSYYDGGGQPAHAAAWTSDRTNADSLDFFRGTRKTLEGAYLRPRHPDYIELQNECSPFVTQALSGELSDQQLASRLDEGVERWLR